MPTRRRATHRGSELVEFHLERRQALALQLALATESVVLFRQLRHQVANVLIGLLSRLAFRRLRNWRGVDAVRRGGG
jgi:hypothetical protein